MAQVSLHLMPRLPGARQLPLASRRAANAGQGVGLCAVAGLMLGLSAAPALADDMASTTYRCDHGALVQATYLNPGDRSFAVVSFEGRQIGFETEAAASGARYVSADGQFVWWTKGDSAMMIHGSGDAETMIYAECAALPG